jgi:hypothetical protein
LVEDENGVTLAYYHSILNRHKNYLWRLLNVYGANDVKQTEIHKAEPLVPEPSPFEFETAIQIWKDTNRQVPLKLR